MKSDYIAIFKALCENVHIADNFTTTTKEWNYVNIIVKDTYYYIYGTIKHSKTFNIHLKRKGSGNLFFLVVNYNNHTQTIELTKMEWLELVEVWKTHHALAYDKCNKRMDEHIRAIVKNFGLQDEKTQDGFVL